MANKIFGTIRDTASGGAPVKGLRVRAWDEDWPDGDDFMGQSITGASGGYQISYQHAHWDRAIGGLPSWRPDIYTTVDIKNAKGDWVHIAKSQVFRDHNLDNDLVINFEVSLRPLVSVRTAFDPMKDGFHFNNLFIVEPDILGVDLGSWKMGFCGGMCSGALDRFKERRGGPPG